MTLTSLNDGERARAQIYFVKEALGLAVEGLSEEQASVSGPSWRARPWRSVGFATGSPGGRRPLVCIAPGRSCAGPARPKERTAMSALLPISSSAIRWRYRGIAGTRNRTGNKRMIGWRII